MENNFDFTPGPWEVFNDNSDMQPIAWCGCSCIDGKDYEVGQRHTQMHEGDAIGDARLIAAAPEMLDALIDSIGIIEDMIDIGMLKVKETENVIDKKIKLIEKATGKKWSEIHGK